MLKKELSSKIKSCKYELKLWVVFMIAGNLQIYLLPYSQNTQPYILAGYVFITLTSLIGMLINIQNIRFYNERLINIFEKEKFEQEIKENNNRFYKIFDNMCDKKAVFSNICKKQFAPILPSNTVKKWDKGLADDVIIGYWAEDNSPYKIKCPLQLRDIIVKLQNNL